jgi:hypothetical protein
MLRFSQLAGTFIIVRLAPEVAMPEWVTSAEFTSITRTADELSIVCPIENVPEEMKAGPRWICLRLEGPFPFSQTGVLLSFSRCRAMAFPSLRSRPTTPTTCWCRRNSPRPLSPLCKKQGTNWRAYEKPRTCVGGPFTQLNPPNAVTEAALKSHS